MSRPNYLRGGRCQAAAALTVAALVIVLGLAGCGRKANPQPPPGEPATYPRAYPSE
jgi:hypothetical protein